MSFLWRGRLYVVREVLGHWRERREWWAAAAARALHGDGGEAGSGEVVEETPEWLKNIVVKENSVERPDDAPSERENSTRWGHSTGVVASTALGSERDVWRVEASAGRSFGNGVYDLCREPASDPTPRVAAWRLVQVAD